MKSNHPTKITALIALLSALVVLSFMPLAGGETAGLPAPDGQPTPTPTPCQAGNLFLSGDDADDGGHCQGTDCGGLYPAALSSLYNASQSPGDGIIAIGVNGSTALIGFNSWNLVANGGPGAPVTFATTAAQIAAINFTDFKLIYIPSDSGNTSGGITAAQMSALNARQAAIADFINNSGGSLLALTEGGLVNQGAYGWLPLTLTFVAIDYFDVCPEPALLEISPNTTQANMSHAFYHIQFTGPSGFSGLLPLAFPCGGNPSNNPAILGGLCRSVSSEICNDGIDNDGDGLIDCDDPDCTGAPNCQPTPTPTPTGTPHPVHPTPTPRPHVTPTPRPPHVTPTPRPPHATPTPMRPQG